jgi:CubicO group peptidase (beta-lactamase class C family)
MGKKFKLSFNWRQYSLLIIAIVLLVMSALPSSGPSIADLLAVDYTPLVREDWEISTPAEQGLDPMLVAKMYYYTAQLETLYSLLVVKNGYLIAEDYFNEGSIDQKDRLQSVTKSYTSALVGIALDQGYLSSVDQKMLDFFPEVADQITDPRKEQITIRELLQMRSGYPWEETDPALWDGLLSGYYMPLIEEFPLIADLGTEFNYSNLSSNWLGIIVDRATGMNLKACVFEGNQVVPADWVHDSLQRYSEDINATGGFPANWGLSFRDIGYGYQWWSARAGDHHFYFAWGHGGQLIVLLDDLDMIVVVTSDPFWLQHDAEAWKHELANINLVGEFIKSLPSD